MRRRVWERLHEGWVLLMKKLRLYDKLNAASLLLCSPECRKVKRARKKAESFETPDVSIPTETRNIAEPIS